MSKDEPKATAIAFGKHFKGAVMHGVALRGFKNTIVNEGALEGLEIDGLYTDSKTVISNQGEMKAVSLRHVEHRPKKRGEKDGEGE